MRHKIIFSLILVVLLIGIVSAEASYCCEKTTYGASCQNEDETNCNPLFRKAPTHCDATDFCKSGCCYNSNEGNCLPNTPEGPCNDGGGVWEDSISCDIPQCKLGCCLIGDQATFVTQTRCKRLSTLYGIGINFRKNIQNEFECISSASSKEKGACVFEDKEYFERTCTISTREECLKLGVEVEFYKGRLCSDATLGTICAPSEETTCVEGKDQVYYLDTCGNLANIYDSSKLLDTNYWSVMRDVLEVCTPPNSPSETRTCGNCDYFLGTTCKNYENGVDPVQPDYGDNICRDLSCNYKGKIYAHGEKWCGVSGGLSQVSMGNLSADTDPITENLPGSRYFRLICYNGEVTVDPCSDFRQEICIQGEIVTGFKTAECRVNRWEDCRFQLTQGDCTREDQRDCKWINSCIPRYTPGFDFWESQEDAQALCNVASVTCVVKYGKDGLGGNWVIENHEECLEMPWLEGHARTCASLGDCGSTVNYVNIDGYFSTLDLRTISGRLDDQEELEDELNPD